MNSPIIFQIIASFLDVATLLRFRVSCKMFLKISEHNELWEKLFKNKYISNLELFG